jgi:hypothetical protein
MIKSLLRNLVGFQSVDQNKEEYEAEGLLQQGPHPACTYLSMSRDYQR